MERGASLNPRLLYLAVFRADMSKYRVPEEWPVVDKTAFEIVDENESSSMVAYWRTRPIEERIAGVLRLREIFYGAEASARLRRVLEFVDQE